MRDFPAPWSAPRNGPRRSAWTAWRLFAIVLAGHVPGALRAAEVLTRIEDVRDLTAEQAARSVPVHIRGTVTWKTGRGLTVQQGSAGTWVHLTEARAQHVWITDNSVLRAVRPGDVLDIEGFSTPGAFAPGVMPATLQIVGREPLPPPQPFNPARFFSGADDGLRVQVRGVVQGVHAGDDAWVLNLNADPGLVAVEFPRSALANPHSLVDAEVRVTGVATVRFNSRGEITMPRVFSSMREELVVEKPGSPPFAAPLVPLAHIMPYRRNPTGPHRVRVIGTVTLAVPGRYLYLQEGESALRVETRSETVFHPGDRVEAAGFGDMSRYIGALAEAEVRRVGRADVPDPIAINPEEVLRLNADALNRGVRAEPNDFDGQLIRFRAGLLTVQSSPDSRRPERRLVLYRGENVVNATLSGPASAALERLRPGSELDVTGIVELDYTPTVDARRSGVSLMPTRLGLILRGPEDVAVVRAPSWWTPGRLLAAVGVVVAALGAALLWVWQLRRQVRRKAERLAEEIRARRDAAVEFQATLRERNRLAANLHDTLLQTLGGIGFEIGACEAEASAAGGRPPARLAVARRILDLAVSELRGSVWALRSLPLERKGLVEALRAVAARELAGKSVEFSVTADGEFTAVPDFVAGNLVLAAQEALRNAVRHGRPRHLRVELTTSAKRDRIRLTVVDDGVGFALGTEAGPADGHFGLIGMRERIERLDGTLTIRTAPGAGTTVSLDVPVREYDEAVGGGAITGSDSSRG